MLHPSFVIIAIIFMIFSVALGYKWGKERQLEILVDEVKQEIKEEFLQKLIEEYDKKVEERALEIVAPFLAEYEERKKEDETIHHG